MHKEHKVQVARVRAVHEKSMQSKEGSTYTYAGPWWLNSVMQGD